MRLQKANGKCMHGGDVVRCISEFRGKISLLEVRIETAQQKKFSHLKETRTVYQNLYFITTAAGILTLSVEGQLSA